MLMQEMHLRAANLKDALFVAIILALLGDTATWSALVIFLMVGAVVMRVDFIDAVKEEAMKDGLQSMKQVSLIPNSLILGCGVALAFAGAHRWHISGHLSDEVGIFFLSAVLVIGLATTISNSPKSRI